MTKEVKFDWEGFKNGNYKVAVHCDTEEKANDFLKECDKQKIEWCDGENILIEDDNYWTWNMGETCYSNCMCGICEIGYAGKGFYKNEGLQIVEWEVEKMKELTFKEVIVNIKEGEVWENRSQRVAKIYINKSGNVQLEGIDNGFSQNYSTCVSLNTKYKLQRKEYTFEEAYKLYKEGVEVESVISHQRYKFEDNKHQVFNSFFNAWRNICDSEFNGKEIDGKWYINN